MDIEHVKSLLFTALLKPNGLQEIMDVAADLLGNPVFVGDRGLAVVCRSSTAGVEDPIWSDDPSDHLETIRVTAIHGDFRKMYATDAPVISSFSSSPHRYMACRVRSGEDVLGHIVVIEFFRRFEEGDLALAPMISQAIALELGRSRRPELDTLSHGMLLEDLVSGRVGPEEAEMRLLRIGASLPRTMRVLVLEQIPGSQGISPEYVRLQLSRVFPLGIGIVRGGTIVNVIDGTISRGATEERLRRSVYTDSLAIGMSRPFSGLDGIRAGFVQASAAVRLGDSSRGGGVTEYDDIFAAHIMERALKAEPDTRALLHPGLVKLEEYDRANLTDHVRFLHAYLFSGRNVAKTAKRVSAHKNTVYYRIRRIEELLGESLSDERTCFALQLSFALQGFGVGAEYVNIHNREHQTVDG